MSTPAQQNYELPKLVESVRQGWITSSQAIAVVGALFAAGETALIPFVKTAAVDGDGKPKMPAHPGLFKLLLIVSYSAFLFNASATISSLILIDKLGEMSFLNRAKAITNNPLAAPESVQHAVIRVPPQALIELLPALQTGFYENMS
ncbi:hypothetical protein FRC04_003786 [Tulasnella sp. 424]|nr:hypothetical protein FRC04_003786 [Tulasnella sp. 424]KAG8965068.1 hypothetical protein FRC05_003383 [Tulasnella sp. 425]